jgi:nitrate/nitrite transporter NarK
MPAEVFPTKFRCCLYGIAAAFGKLGAVLVQIVILKMGTPLAVRWLLVSFAACMTLGALCSHFFPVRRNKERVSMWRTESATLCQNTSVGIASSSTATMEAS